MNPQRLQKVRSYLSEQGASGIFITSPYNIFYITGFFGISPTEREAALFINHEKVYLFVPRMYEGMASAAVKNVFIPVEVVVDAARIGIFSMLRNYVSSNDVVLCEAHDLRMSEFESIRNDVPCKLQPQKKIIESPRLVKDDYEIAMIQKACDITDQVFADLIQFLEDNDYTQFTKNEIVDVMRKFGHDYQAQGFSFDPIVAVGVNTSFPHHKTGNEKLKNDKPLLLDFGFSYKGYCSDMTRNIYLGKASVQYRKMYDLVLSAQKTAFASLCVGMKAGDVYKSAVEIFSQQNQDQYFLHGLGHGLGLEIHEGPYLRSGSEELLQNGMVFTIEPGLYYDNTFGIRIEDVVLLGKNKITLLTQSPKDLIEIKHF